MTRRRINSTLTILTDVSDKAMGLLQAAHCKRYVDACTREGVDVPTDEQCARWWKATA